MPKKREQQKMGQWGEVWIVDLGLAAKARPCLILSVLPADEDRDLVTVVPHTTAARGTRFEVPVACRFLKQGAFDAQNILTVPAVKLTNRIGRVTSEQLESIVAGVCRWLGIQ
jgi:mRNA interferase MazF